MRNQEELLQRWFPDQPEVHAFIESLGFISQVWDDLIDNDKKVPASDINEAFVAALFSVKNNPFFRSNEVELDFLMVQAIRNWFEANQLEADGEVPLHTYTLRSAITPVLVHLGYLINGPEKGQEIALEIRRAVFDEPFEEYVDGLSKETKEAGSAESDRAREGTLKAV